MADIIRRNCLILYVHVNMYVHKHFTVNNITRKRGYLFISIDITMSAKFAFFKISYNRLKNNFWQLVLYFKLICMSKKVVFDCEYNELC